jgi:hypothetical protein
MRRSFELFTLQHLVFIAPLIAGRSASVAAKCTAVCPAACVVHIAGIDVRTGVGVILDHVAVTLYLTFDGRRSFSKIPGYLSDGMMMIETVFNLGAVSEGKVRTFLRR